MNESCLSLPLEEFTVTSFDILKRKYKEKAILANLQKKIVQKVFGDNLPARERKREKDQRHINKGTREEKKIVIIVVRLVMLSVNDCN